MTTVEDLRFALRLLRKNRTLTIVAVVTLAVGIAINATVFSWIDSVRFHPFPGVHNPGELALVETVTSAGETLVATSYVDYRDYRDNLKLVSGLAVARFTPLSMGNGGTHGAGVGRTCLRQLLRGPGSESGTGPHVSAGGGRR